MPHPGTSSLCRWFLVWRPANQLFRRSYKEQLNSNVAISIHLVTAPYVDQFYKLVVVFLQICLKIFFNYFVWSKW
jgi:hypothetical protein